MNYQIEKTILRKIFTNKQFGYSFGAKYPVYYRNMGNFFFKLAFEVEPKYYKDGEEQSSSTVSGLSMKSKLESEVAIGIINSTLFYYYWIIFSDCYHLSKNDVSTFPIDFSILSELAKNKIAKSTRKYLVELEKNAVWQIENKKDGTIKKYRRYFPQNCKSISDEIDTALAEHYGFSDEELDFMINYDIKYRMGKELENDED